MQPICKPGPQLTDKGFTEIELKLGITLPEEYRRVLIQRQIELAEAGCFDGQFSSIYLSLEDVIYVNFAAREHDSEIAAFFPSWWDQFFLIGTNGAGNFYCLRLNQKPGVWMIGSDCGNEPDQLFESLNELIDLRFGRHREQLENDRRHQELGRDAEAVELAAAESAEDSKAREWVIASSP